MLYHCIVLRWNTVTVCCFLSLSLSWPRPDWAELLLTSLTLLFWLTVHQETPTWHNVTRRPLQYQPSHLVFTTMRRLLVQLIKGCRGRHKSKFSLQICLVHGSFGNIDLTRLTWHSSELIVQFYNFTQSIFLIWTMNSKIWGEILKSWKIFVSSIYLIIS